MKHNSSQPLGLSQAIRCQLWAVGIVMGASTAGALAAAASDPNGCEPSAAAAAPSAKVVDPNWFRPRTPERAKQRENMVAVIRDRYGLKDKPVLEALRQVPRHWFVPAGQLKQAYADRPLPIGHGQTISQPFIVAYMTHLLQVTPRMKVLEVGTGSAYQAAVLAELTPQVYSLEIIEPLARQAAQRLKKRQYATIRTRTADGYWGWPKEAPFDAIIVTCAADHIPPSLIEQLKPGGRMVIPVGGAFRVQRLMLVSKDAKNKVTSKALMAVRFVPFVSEKKK